MPANQKLELVIAVDAEKGNVEVKRFNKNLETIGKSAQQSSSQAGGALDNLMAKIAAGVAIGALLADTIKKLVFAAKDMVLEFGRSSEALLNLADRTGLTAREAAEFSAVARVVGVDINALVPSMRKLSEGLAGVGDEGKETRTALEQLGISAIDIKGQLKPTGQLLLEIARNIRGLTVPDQRLALDRILGRGAGELLPFFKQLIETLPKVREAGVGSLGDMAEKGAALDDALGLVKERWRVLEAVMVNKIVGVIEVVMPGFLNPKSPDFGKLPSAIEFIDNVSRAMSVAMVKALGNLPRGSVSLTLPTPRPGRLPPPPDEGAARKLRDAEKQAHQFMVSAQEREANGIGRILLERQKLLDQYGKSKRAIAEIEAGVRSLILAESRQIRRERFAREFGDAKEEALADIQARESRERDLAKTRGELFRDSELVRRGAIEQTIALEMDRLNVSSDARLRQLEMLDAQTLQQKIALEQAKFEIEREFLAKSFDLQIRQMVRRTQLEIAEKQMAARLAGATQVELDTIRMAREEMLAADVGKLSLETNAKVAAARDQATIRSVALARDENQRLFDHLKDASGRVFDAMIAGGQNVWNVFKNAALTALREIVSSTVARALFNLFGGQGPAPAPAGAGGLGRFLGVGAFGVPLFAGGGGGGLPGQIGTPRFPGGTGTFTGAPLNLGGGALFPGGTGGLGALFGRGQLGGPLGKLFGSLPGIPFPESGFGIGVGGQAAAGGGLLAGATLAFLGLRRGGFSGLGLSIGGGALAGFSVAGPIGAVIGAGAGAVAGIVRLFVKGAQEKAREKIKATYGVDIRDKGVLKQIVDMAKQSFGGNLDVAIRSKQVRELIELYAMATGQKFGGASALPAGPLNVAQLGGGRLFEAPVFGGGSFVPQTAFPLVGPAAIDTVTAGGAQAGSPIVIQLDGPATTSLLRGEAVTVLREEPREVAGAVLRAQRGSFGRRESLVMQLSPSLVTN